MERKPKTETKQPEAATEPAATKVFKVVPLDRSGLPNFPSSRETACRDLENYLNSQAAEGYHLLTVIDRNVGVQPIKLLVFKAT